MPFFIRRLYGEYTLIILVLLAGIGLSLWSAWQYQQDTQQRTVAEFQDAAQHRVELISEKIDHNNIVMRSVAAFFRSSENIDRTEFKTFTHQLLKDYPYIHALEWLPHVTGPERARYENNADTPDFSIIEGEAEKQKPAAVRDEYFPIYYIEPMQNGNTMVLGFDVASDPGRRKTLQHARDTNRSAVTSRTHLLSDGDVPAVIFYEPVIKTVLKEDGKNYDLMTGFVGSVVPLPTMLDAAIKPLNFAWMNIIIHDLSAEQDEEKILYIRSTRLKKISDQEIIQDYQNQGALTEKKILEVSGRKWQITVLPARGHYMMTTQRGTYLILACGTIFTFLLVFYMLGRIQENDRVNREVEERTEQLSKAKRETEMILLSTHDGITGIDQNGIITFCNPTASQLLGYGKKELIGKNHHALLHYKRADGSPYNAEDCPIQRIMDYGQPCNVRDEVFWNKNGDPVQIEYTASPIFEGGDISGAVLVFRDVAERRALENKLEQMARYDQLTGLANRSLFIEHLKAALSRAERNKQRLGVIYLDLNGFKPINDTLGHAAGDVLLKKFAACLQDIVRDSDIAARLGGDEFTILADNIGEGDECLRLVERLRERLKQPFEIGGQNFQIGTSIGIAYYPDHAADSDDLITAADAAMYEAKKDKTLPWVTYTPLKKTS